MEMRFEYTVTKKDYENFLYYELQKRLKMGAHGLLIPFIIVSFTCSMILGMVMVIVFSDEPMLLLPTMVFAVVILIFLWFITNKRVQAKLILRRQIKSGEIARAYFGSHVLEVKQDRLRLRYGDMEGECYYGGIDHITEYKTAIAIYLTSVSCHIIPNTAFRDMEECRHFVSLIRSRMAAANNVAIGREMVDEDHAEVKYTFDFSWDEQGLINALVAANRAFFKSKLAWTPKRIIMTIIGLFCCVRGVTAFFEIMTVITDYRQSAMVGMIVLLITGVALLIHPIMVVTPWIRQIVTKQVMEGADAQRAMIGGHTICFYDNKIKLISSLSNQDVSMEQIYGVMRTDRYLFLLSKIRVILIVPISAFDSEKILVELIEFVESKIRLK